MEMGTTVTEKVDNVNLQGWLLWIGGEIDQTQLAGWSLSHADLEETGQSWEVCSKHLHAANPLIIGLDATWEGLLLVLSPCTSADPVEDGSGSGHGSLLGYYRCIRPDKETYLLIFKFQSGEYSPIMASTRRVRSASAF